MIHLHVGRGRALLAGLAAALIAAVASAEPSADAPEAASVDAVWKPQRLAFQYRGYSTFYSCGGLQAKLQHILLSMGAREDMRISGYACDERLGSARFEILFHSPVEATLENVRALTTYSAEDELIARTSGEALVSATDLPRFPAQWQKVSFAHDRRMRLEPRDCELVRAVRAQILARMSVRVVQDRAQCSPGFGNSGPPRLTVVALVPMQKQAVE